MNKNLQIVLNTALTISISFIIAGIVLLISGGDPLKSLSALLDGAFGTTSAIGETIVKSIPLIIAGLSVAIGMRAGLFNIGAEGQLFMGGVCSAWIGFAIDLPPSLHIPLCLIAGMIGGGAWGLIPGILRAYRGVSEVISTIMLNYIAFFLTHYLVSGPLKDPNTMSPQTPEMGLGAQLGSIAAGSQIHWGILIAVISTIIYGILIQKSRIGYEIRAVGLSAEASAAAGINVPKIIITAMISSGALAGLAGAVEVMGVHHKFYDQFSPGYGFDSIAVALLGNCGAVGTFLSAMLFGALKNGAINMQLETGSPKEIVAIIQAIIIVLAGIRLLKSKRSVSVKKDDG